MAEVWFTLKKGYGNASAAKEQIIQKNFFRFNCSTMRNILVLTKLFIEKNKRAGLEQEEKAFRAFLIESQNPDEREFLDDESQIKEIFVHGNYLSFEDIKIAQHYDISVLAGEIGFANIQSLAQTLHDLYKEEE